VSNNYEGYLQELGLAPLLLPDDEQPYTELPYKELPWCDEADIAPSWCQTSCEPLPEEVVPVAPALPAPALPEEKRGLLPEDAWLALALILLACVLAPLAFLLFLLVYAIAQALGVAIWLMASAL
jgi:hypothetical protein